MNAMSTDETKPASLAAVLIPLFKGVTYRVDDPAHWQSLLGLQARAREHAAVLGLNLIVDETEGYAFLQSMPEQDGADKLPRLVARRPLSFPVSLLLALLRKRLAEFDAAGGETRLIVSRDQVADMLRVFLPDGSNQARLIDQVDAHLNRVVELGFLRRLRSENNMFEVQRILKAFVDAQWLAEFDARLAAYRARLETPEGARDDD